MGGLAESATLALAKRVRALKAEGKPVISLTLGEPDFDTPDPIRAAAIAAIHEGDTHYPPVAGLPALREAAAQKFRTQNGIACSPEHVVVSTGAKQSLLNVLMALVNPGDEVVILAPYWVSYLPMVYMAEGVPVVVPPTDPLTLKVSPEAIAEAITPRTKVLIFNSPSNPTGLVYTPAEVDAVAEVLARNPHVVAIADEIYEHIRYGAVHKSLASIAEVAPRVVTINGVSKAFAMTGWRIGYLCAPAYIARAAETYQGQVTSGASSISQRAALAALTQDLAPTRAMVEEFHARRDQFCADLQRLAPELSFRVPDGAFYLYPDISAYLGRHTPDGLTLGTPSDFNDYLLAAALVCGVPSEAFGTQHHIRFSYASSRDDLAQAALRIGEALRKLT